MSWGAKISDFGPLCDGDGGGGDVGDDDDGWDNTVGQNQSTTIQDQNVMTMGDVGMMWVAGMKLMVIVWHCPGWKSVVFKFISWYFFQIEKK